MHHSPELQQRWLSLSLVEQMANVGSEVERSLRWREKQNPESEHLALERALELLDFTLGDGKNRGRLKEVARVRELLVDYFLAGNTYDSSATWWRKYFYQFGYLARIRREQALDAARGIRVAPEQGQSAST